LVCCGVVVALCPACEPVRSCLTSQRVCSHTGKRLPHVLQQVRRAPYLCATEIGPAH